MPDLGAAEGGRPPEPVLRVAQLQGMQGWVPLPALSALCLQCAQARSLPATHPPAEISALITCTVELELEPDDSATADDLVQTWPSCAPAPERLHIALGSPRPLLLFLASCAQQEPAAQLPMDVRKLVVDVSCAPRVLACSVGGIQHPSGEPLAWLQGRGPWGLSDQEAPEATSMLHTLSWHQQSGHGEPECPLSHAQSSLLAGEPCRLLAEPYCCCAWSGALMLSLCLTGRRCASWFCTSKSSRMWRLQPP